MRHKVLTALVILLSVAFCATAADAVVQTFIDKNTVRVNDPELGKTVLNDFSPTGWRTHNYLVLVWNDMEAATYDIRTHQWMFIDGFAPVSGLLSDNVAMIWEPSRVAVFDARARQWIASDFDMQEITQPLLSRGMAAVTTLDEFVVYDPVLVEWEILGGVAPRDALLGDNLAVCWNTSDAYVYDTTLHRWIRKEGIEPQACIMEDYKLSIYTAGSIHIYDAMTHRWTSEAR
ncbi:MAG: hypothetical protein K9L28_09845 [Synergistales bacterium]|nr:hypothetical protein [Synergistales bacterium]